jgi:hypothetical protein
LKINNVKLKNLTINLNGYFRKRDPKSPGFKPLNTFLEIKNAVFPALNSSRLVDLGRSKKIRDHVESPRYAVRSRPKKKAECGLPFSLEKIFG